MGKCNSSSASSASSKRPARKRRSESLPRTRISKNASSTRWGGFRNGNIYDELKLKIMTFDTCQGEERDIVFYSMVANRAVDRLWGVFIKDLASVDLEEEGKLKAQRLNVGFSRAKECMHFVLSKPLSEYQGAIGEALRHFWNVREEAKKERSTAEVDPRSEREAQVLNWFYQTTLWKEEIGRAHV